MYTTYITEALVCGSKDNNTSDRSYLLFTREGGMVWARAKSVRLERSKQRFALQDFSFIRATLVHGKAGWRVAGVESLGNTYYETDSREARGMVRNTVRLLRRVIQGETPHQMLYDDVHTSFLECNAHDPEVLELLLTLRILHGLGYVAPESSLVPVLEQRLTHDYIDSVSEEQKRLYKDIVVHALQQSQL